MLNGQWLIFLREVEHIKDDRLVASVLAVMVPTTWDETRVLAAKAGDYYVVAKRKGQSNPIHPTQAPLSSQRWLVRLDRITGR